MDTTVRSLLLQKILQTQVSKNEATLEHILRCPANHFARLTTATSKASCLFKCPWVDASLPVTHLWQYTRCQA